MATGVTTISNITFVLVAIIILFLGVDDFLYFRSPELSPPSPTTPSPLQDYTAATPPNLVLGGGGIFHLMLVILACGCLIYAAVGSFLFHASLTPVGLKYDMLSVWTLVTLILPYLAANHMFRLKSIPFYGPRIVTLISAAGVVVSICWPSYASHKFDALLVVPVGAGMHFVLLVTYYAIGCYRVKLRSPTDLYLIFLATLSMGIAYLFQDDAKFCSGVFLGPDSWFQGHAVWHSGMALGVMFFYLFLRQERPREGIVWEARKKKGSGGSTELFEQDDLEAHRV
jgi:hypothetical protein